jgi:hypothetical protein
VEKSISTVGLKSNTLLSSSRLQQHYNNTNTALISQRHSQHYFSATVTLFLQQHLIAMEQTM